MVISMKRDDLVSLRGGLGNVAVLCEMGRIWITVSGDEKDHILSSGEEFMVPRRRKVVIMADTGSMVRFYKPLSPESLSGTGLVVVPNGLRDQEVFTC